MPFSRGMATWYSLSVCVFARPLNSAAVSTGSFGWTRSTSRSSTSASRGTRPHRAAPTTAKEHAPGGIRQRASHQSDCIRQRGRRAAARWRRQPRRRRLQGQAVRADDAGAARVRGRAPQCAGPRLRRGRRRSGGGGGYNGGDDRERDVRPATTAAATTTTAASRATTAASRAAGARGRRRRHRCERQMATMPCSPAAPSPLRGI